MDICVLCKNEVITKLCNERWFWESRFNIKLQYKKLLGDERNALWCVCVE